MISRDIEKAAENARTDLEEASILLNSPLRDCPAGRFTFSRGMHRLEVKNLQELHEARVFLRKEFNWRDSLEMVFTSGSNAIATYCPTEGAALPVPFALWLVCRADQFPIEKVSPGCHIEFGTNRETVASIVCERPEE